MPCTTLSCCCPPAVVHRFVPTESCGFCSEHVACRRIQTHIIARAHATNTIFIPYGIRLCTIEFRDVTMPRNILYNHTTPTNNYHYQHTVPPTVNHHRYSDETKAIEPPIRVEQEGQSVYSTHKSHTFSRSLRIEYSTLVKMCIVHTLCPHSIQLYYTIEHDLVYNSVYTTFSYIALHNAVGMNAACS